MGHQWVVTNTYTRYGEPRGWKLHAVEADESAAFEDIKGLDAACGLRSKRGWGLDLFIEKKCARCLVATGRACTYCRGKGSTGSALSGTWDSCQQCGGSGERRALEPTPCGICGKPTAYHAPGMSPTHPECRDKDSKSR